MLVIAPLAIATPFLAGSVGGPLFLMMLFFAAALAAGIYEAWSKMRGVFGWIVSIGASLVGGFAGVSLASMAMESILPHLHLNGSLASTGHPLFYISIAGMMIITLVGSWAALLIVNRMR